ncbi:MAG: class II aldolase/adducin family protein [Terriglobia bacterium]
MPDSHEALKSAIIEKCRALEKIGYFVGTWGNVSVRVPEGFIVTPSRIGYDRIQTNDFVAVSAEGGVVAGHRLPSSETEIHRAVLKKKTRCCWRITESCVVAGIWRKLLWHRKSWRKLHS